MSKKIFSFIKLPVFILFFVFLDQLSKYFATIKLKGQNDIAIIKDVLILHYLDGGNTGAAWGILSGKIAVFVLFTIIAVIIIAIFIKNINVILNTNYSLKKSKLILLKYMLALLTAGAVGNLTDRLIHRYVIDFIYFKPINFPVFNIADCYVTIACFVIIIICLFKLKEDEFNQIFTLKLKRN